jgi:hypothetical protein
VSELIYNIGVHQDPSPIAFSDLRKNKRDPDAAACLNPPLPDPNNSLPADSPQALGACPKGLTEEVFV